MTDSYTLIAEYAQQGSEAAFREVVSRYIDFVYSTALRLVGRDAHLAEDVTQTVFIDLARTAHTLSSDVLLGGWLHRHTCFVASKLLRAERRRQARERKAVEMNSLPDHSETSLAQIAPLLDEAINALGAEDRSAILLRFFEQQDFATVGVTLGTSEDAARKRVGRALEKLHALLQRRGVTLSAASLGTTLAAGVVSAAPAGLATGIAGTALASAVTGGGILALILKFMPMTKTATAVAGLALICGLGVALNSEHRTVKQLRVENESLQEQVKLLVQQQEEVAQLVKIKPELQAAEQTRREHQELLRLRGEVGRLNQQLRESAATAQKKSDAIKEAAQAEAARSKIQFFMLNVNGVAGNVAYENNGLYPTNIDEIKDRFSPDRLRQMGLKSLEELGLDCFEFVPHEKPISTDDYGKLLLRERMPHRRITDGKWSRLYTYVGGVATEAVSEDGNFDQWEREEAKNPTLKRPAKN